MNASRVVQAVVLVSVLGLVAGCGKRKVADADVASLPPRVVLLSPPRTDPEVRSAVVNALVARGWVTENENGNVITARLDHRGANVRASFVLTPERVTVQVLDANGAGKNLEKWVANVEASIREGLTVAVVAMPPAPPPPLRSPPPTTAIFERAQQPQAVKGALQRALGTHSWVIETDEADGVVARLNHRKGMVRVRIVADTTKATITYLDSQELAFDATGRSDEYEKWMRNLVEAIRANTR